MKVKKIKNVLYIGKYSRNYARNYIFINGLRKQNINVYEFNANDYKYGKINELKYFIKNFKKLKNLDIDIILFYSEKAPIPFIFAKIIALVKNVPLIHDIYISKLLTFYYDRKLKKTDKIKIIPKQFYWLYYYLLDFLECCLSNYIILDTYSHIKYFHEKFKVSLKKLRRVFVGAIDKIFYPIDKKENEGNSFIVGFYGTFIPLQGIEYIIKSANLLEKYKDLTFIIIGKGQTYEKNRKLARILKIKNIEFIDPVPMERLPELMSKFDIGLGIFGNTIKALHVIPNKIVGCIAMKIPVISSDTPAIRELFTNNHNIILCERANPGSLARAILKLKNDDVLRENIKENGYVLFKENCSIEVIGKRLLGIINNYLDKNLKN
ncbi:MAG: glycosyltransferase [Candidatus Hodarchaeota archaeon]